MRDHDPIPSIFLKTKLPTRLIPSGFSGVENVEMFAGWIVLRFPDSWLPNIEEFDLNTDDCVRWNVAGNSVCTVGQMGTDGQFPLSTNAHPLDPVSQTGNTVPPFEIDHHPWSTNEGASQFSAMVQEQSHVGYDGLPADSLVA